MTTKSFQPDYQGTRSSCFNAKIALIPWDSEIYDCTAAQLIELQLLEEIPSLRAYQELSEIIETKKIDFCTARVASSAQRESFFLQNAGFKFVDTYYELGFEDLTLYSKDLKQEIIQKAGEEDLEILCSIANQTFTHERFYTDFRLDRDKAGVRYQRWVKNSWNDPNEEILTLKDKGNNIKAFFISSFTANKEISFRLTAVAPNCYGQGIGTSMWHSVLLYYKDKNFRKASVVVSGSNYPVLNLWGKLGFKIITAEKIFHWLKY